ncbi:MAG: ATP-binding protein [Verrucomicrobiota bacterium]
MPNLFDRRLAVGHLVLALSLAATLVEYRIVRAQADRQAEETFSREIEVHLDNARDGLWRYAYAARTVAATGRLVSELDWHQHLTALHDLGLADGTVRLVSAGNRAPQYPVGTDLSSDPLLRAAQRLALTSQQPVACGTTNCILFVPAATGFAFATFTATDLWQDLLRQSQLSPVTLRLLGPGETPPGNARVVSMTIWGLHWRLAGTARPSFANTAGLYRPWLFLVGGLAMTALVAGFAYFQALRRLRLQRANEELNRLKGQFVSTVSHEFRTPLGVIVSSAGILDRYFDRLPPEQRREHLANIQTSGKRMAELMESALLFSRLEANRLAFNPQPLDLAAFCRQFDSGCICVDVPATVNADEALLRHILTNLLSNAAKYSQAPVTLEVRGTTLRVIDHGIGIPAAEIATLGEPFRRASNAGEVPGTGLGLFIVKRCVEIHGGTLAFASEVGKGTTVTVTL